jgi:hypothetical protein
MRHGYNETSTFEMMMPITKITSLFGWLVADDWCWFVPREKYYWLVVGG